MTIINGIDKLMSMQARGSFGYSCGYGLIKRGLNRFGLYTQYAGIYSLKKTKKGKEVSRMVFYRPTNPRTTKQQNHRNKFEIDVNVWHGLLPYQKIQYNNLAKSRRISGYNLFISEYINSH